MKQVRSYPVTGYTLPQSGCSERVAAFPNNMKIDSQVTVITWSILSWPHSIIDVDL